MSNGTTFFIAGFDTVSSALAVLFYQLAVNPDAQEKVYEEVADILDTQEQIEYDNLQNLKYLDMCIKESLRMIPPLLKTERKAKNTVTIKGIKIEKDMLVGIPILHLHYDDKRWDNPYVFRPERFSEEQKKDRSPLSWMPFGYGPRNCIGMRLALVEVKIVAAHFIHKFCIETCSKTQIPLDINKFGLIREGMDVKLIPRAKS